MIYGKDRLTLITVSEGTIAPNGDYINGEREESAPVACDAVPSKGQASTIKLPDGTQGRYSYEITLDVDCPEFEYGDTVALVTAGKRRQEFSVLGFHRYQFQSKLWV